MFRSTSVQHVTASRAVGRSTSSIPQATGMRYFPAGTFIIQTNRFLLGQMMNSARQSFITTASSTRNFYRCSPDRGLAALAIAIVSGERHNSAVGPKSGGCLLLLADVIIE